MRAANALSPDDPRKLVETYDAQQNQRRWQCPRAGYALPPKGALEHECRVVLEAVGDITGFRDACTCPRAYLALPYVVRAATARAWRDHGQLELIEPQPMPAVLASEIDAIDVAYSDRLTTEAREREDKAKRDAALRGASTG